MARALSMRQDDFPNFTTPKMMMSTSRGIDNIPFESQGCKLWEEPNLQTWQPISGCGELILGP
jgi:hypothetical protein